MSILTISYRSITVINTNESLLIEIFLYLHLYFFNVTPLVYFYLRSIKHKHKNIEGLS